jgi:hypothetical protein
MPVVTIPGQGDVEFPDSMSDADITAAIKRLSPPPPPQHGRIAEALHQTAHYLPMAGGIAGGALGAGAGAPTGPGAILMGALGAGLLGGAGRLAQRGIDSSLGYEEAPGVMDATKDAGKAAVGEAAGAAGGAVAGEALGMGAKALSGPLRSLALATTKRILRNTGGSIAASKPLSDEAAQEVLDIGAVKTFGTSGGAAERLRAARGDRGRVRPKIVKALEDAGITGPTLEPLGAEVRGRKAPQQNPVSEATPVYEQLADKLSGRAGPRVADRGGEHEAQPSGSGALRVQADAAQRGRPRARRMPRR